MTHDPTHSRRSSSDLCLIVLFLAAIWAPTADSWLRPNSTSELEKAELRRAAPRPSLELSGPEMLSFPERFTSYFDDSLGLRDRLLRWRSIQRMFLFGVSPSPKVMLAKDGWMFFTPMSSMEIFRGVDPLTTQELESWRRALESQRDYLARHGIQYLYVIGPNKESIYPDHVPPEENRVGPSRMDQLVAYLQEHSDFRILDLRPALIAARAEDRPDDHLYYELGTHWNGRGAWVAAHEVLKRLRQLFPAIPPVERSDVRIATVPGHGDSQAQGMYIEDLVPQRSIWYETIQKGRSRLLSTQWDAQHPRRLEVDDPRLPRALIFHDSFGPGIEPILKECFRHSTWFNCGEFDISKIEEEEPDVVIALYVERVFANPPPTVVTDATIGPRATGPTWEDTHDVRLRLDLSGTAIPITARGGTQLGRGRDDEGEYISVDMITVTDMFLLPEFAWPERGRTLVQVDITSPVPTLLALFYLGQGQTNYSHQSCCSAALAKGRNRLVLEIAESGLHGRLMIRPGEQVERYLLRGIEVRAAPPR